MFKAAVFAGSMLLAVPILPVTAQELVDGSNTGAILDVARGYGSAALTTAPDGSPEITGNIDGIDYKIYLVDCGADQSCEHLYFYGAFRDAELSIDRANGWNNTKLYGRAFVDPDGDAIVDMDTVVAFGVSRANLDSNFSIWRLVLTEFAKYLGL